MHCIFNRGVKNTDKYNEIRNASFSFLGFTKKGEGILCDYAKKF